jgi:hypothetical protein
MIFDILQIVPASKIVDGNELIEPTIKILFKRKINTSILVAVDTYLQGKYQRQFCEPILEKRLYQRGEQLKIPLAKIPEAANQNPVWYVKDGEKSLIRHSINLCTIMVGGQKYKIYLRHINRGAGDKGHVDLELEDNKKWDND